MAIYIGLISAMEINNICDIIVITDSISATRKTWRGTTIEEGLRPPYSNQETGYT